MKLLGIVTWPSHAVPRSSSVASKTQLLVDAQRSRHQYGAALRSLARAVPLAADHLPQLLTAWAKVKRDAFSRQQPDCLVSPPAVRPGGGAGEALWEFSVEAEVSRAARHELVE